MNATIKYGDYNILLMKPQTYYHKEGGKGVINRINTICSNMG